MEIFTERVIEYTESESVNSPIWIWYEKSKEKKDEAKCLICKKTILCKFASTSGLITHLKNCHGSLSKYNAAKTLKEMTELKEKRQSSKRKRERVGEEPNKKQKTLTDCLKSSTPYGPQEPRQVAITNAVASMFCVDSAETNMASRPGFSHVVKTLDPRYTLPHHSTFTRSLLP